VISLGPVHLDDRARVHAALGDPRRLRVVDALRRTDLTFSDLIQITGLRGNRLAHHLDALEGAGLLARRISEGDRRRRYLRLNVARLDELAVTTAALPSRALFVCTHNSARSQFAAALWRIATGGDADSAGLDPADEVHPRAVRIAGELGVDLSGAVPKGYGDLAADPELVISVCDRARESGFPEARIRLHWSVPDPVRTADDDAFRSAFGELRTRIETLTASTVSAN
jgi:ArsR family transcriptional regulator, arsenate/arsenite/antimonite-responsive transcriptional repressor / arsenate reductase (thioredoxin)